MPPRRLRVWADPTARRWPGFAVRCHLILDVQPALAGWHENGSELLVQRVAGLADLYDCDVDVVTNSAMTVDPASLPHGWTFTNHAHKPFTHLTRHLDGVVVGDQLLTDGLLAFRMGYDLIYVGHPKDVPLWPRVQRWLGELVRPLFARRPIELI